ncbi:MAG: hypothetical protein ACTSYQ_01100, partial [Candidatus Odinarchaeia archaeon]
MSYDFNQLINKLTEYKEILKFRKETIFRLKPDDSSILEFIDLMINECDKLIMEANQASESTKGIKGVFGARKKKFKLLNGKIEKFKTSLLDVESKLLNYYLNKLIDLEEEYKKVLNEFALLREEMRKKNIVWSSVSDAMNKLIVIRNSFEPVKNRIFTLKDSSKIDSVSFQEISNIIFEISDSLRILDESCKKLEKKLGFRNIVLAKIHTAITKSEELSKEKLEQVNLNLKNFYDRILEDAFSEETDDDYLKDLLSYLDEISDSIYNLIEIFSMLEDSGIRFDILLNQEDLRGALKLIKIIIGNFKPEYKNYIIKLASFTERVRNLALNVTPILTSISVF